MEMPQAIANLATHLFPTTVLLSKRHTTNTLTMIHYFLNKWQSLAESGKTDQGLLCSNQLPRHGHVETPQLS
jgi:hypothetical protein